MSDTSAETPEIIEPAAAGETAGEVQPHEEAAQWSAEAVGRLVQARASGLVAIAIGALLFAVGESQRTLISSLASNGGLTLVVVGLIMIVAAVYTQRLAPDQSFEPRPITSPRMWFVLLWGGGLAVAVLLLSGEQERLVEQLLMLMLGSLLMLAGGVWILRWLVGQRRKLWPASPALLLKWVPTWTVIWAGVWGAFSTFLAIVIEAAPLVLLAVLTGTAFMEVPETRLTSFEELARIVKDPWQVAIVFLSACVGAPLVEEAVKAWGLRGLRRWILSPADGWLLGIASGIGFGLLEGAFLLDTAQLWFTGGWMRLATLLLHGLATSLTGLGYGRYLQSRQREELRRGYLRAVTMHGLWNGCAFTIAFSGVALGMSALASNVVVICFAIVLLIAVIALMILLLRRVSRAGVQSSIQEDYQQAGVPLPGGWSPMPFNLGWRLVGRRPIFVPVTTMKPEALRTISSPPIDDAYPQRVEDDLKSE